MEQFEQLLTCAICLDRYRNPKLLPCQHSFCMEPCMDGLVDYVRRQVKCPECRAEHRIPYQGIQGYPTNVTLQRFLELHIEITGEQPDPTSGQIMKRCAVCTEKAYCIYCSHCSKDVCPQCKAAHMDILRREISRINHQVRRSVGRLQDVLAIVEKNMAALQQNCGSVSEEVEEIYRRLSKGLKDRTDYLREEIGRYQTLEMKNLSTLKDNMEMEISNIESNCDLADKHMQSEDVEWEDCELLDAKEIFLKTIDFLRHFEAEMGDYSRRVRFVMAHDPNQLVMHVAGYGDLNIHMPHQFVGMTNNQQLQAPGPGLMRSKSDHRLTAQFRQQEDRYDRGDPDGGRVSPLGGRKFGERYERRHQKQERDYDDYEERPSARSRIRSRLRHHNADTDSDNDTTGRSVRFSDPAPPQRDKTLDTEDVAKGPLSGITRLYDSPRVMKKLQDAQIKKDKPPTPVPEKPKFQPPSPKVKTPAPAAQRQVSEEDEITKIKRQMKQAPGERPDTVQERPGSERVAALRREEEPSPPSRGSPQDKPSSVQSSQVGSGSDESDEGSSVPASPQRKTVPSTVRPQSISSRRSSTASSTDTHTTQGNGKNEETTTAVDGSRNTGAAYSTEELKQRLLERRAARKPFQSRFLRRGARPSVSTPPREKPKEEEESSSEEETSSEESESEEEQPKPKPPEPEVRTPPLRKPSRDETSYTQPSSRWRSTGDTSNTTESTGSSYRPLYGRDRPQTREESPPSYLRLRPSATTRDDDDTTTTTTPHSSSRYGPGGFTSRFLNKSKSSAAVSPEEEDPGPTRRFGATTSASTSSANSPRSRYSALKDRKARLAGSKSSHALGDEDEEDENLSPSAYLASRYDLARSRSSHQVKSREPSPEPSRSSHSAGSSGLGSNSLGSSSAGGTSGEKDGAALSSWARYLKNKYGARGKEPGQVSATNSRRLSLGLPLRQDSDHSDTTEPKNSLGSPTSPTQHPLHQGFAVGSSTRCPYLTKRRQVFSVGSRGSEPGCFTWPRGVAVSPDNHIVVADSSNHRVQVFDSNGIFQKEFGQYGNGEGEFDCLAGVAVNRIGQFIIADRYNHRIQVMDPSGRFLRSFGSQGTSDGRFNYPWGVTTDALGFIYVCDKENHRVQVFQSDGTFVGKFGNHGSKVGQLDHPHYIAVSNTNKVIVSDSNNHRIQIFDVNGRVLSSFGQEGSDEGQFKFPRGVAVDDQGYILVGDSGNNRIQVFSPEGVFMRGFGSWGSGDGEFKGLEGVAVMANSSVLVCDRENHRIQVF